jgi:hypothetical protein
MATTNTVSSGLSTIAPEIAPYYKGRGTAAVGIPGQEGYVPASADYVQGLLPKATEVYTRNYDQVIGNALRDAGLTGEGRVAQMNPTEQAVGTQLNAMQTPGQFGQGSGLANQAGQGQLGTVGQAGQYGSMGAAIGQQGQAIGAGGAEYGSQGANYGAEGANYGAQGQAIGTAGGARYGNLGAQYGAQGVGIGQQATGLAGNALGYGGMGASIGQQAAQAGNNYNQMATNAQAQQAFMSPYIQNALAPQLAEMQRQYGISGAQQQGQATRAGAFGGNRESLMRAENSRNMGMAMNQAIGSGYQNAFQQAQQAQQFGSTLGLQGQQTGIQGAQAGLSGLNAANQAYQTGLQGTAQGLQGAQVGLQGVNAQLAGTAQGIQGAQAGMQGAQIGLQGIDRQLAGNAQGMQGAQIGLQGVGAQQAGYAGANQSAATLGQLGTQQQATDLARLQAMSAQGSSERALAQQGIDARVQDVNNRQYFDQQQLGGMQGILTGVPVNQSSSTTAVTTPAPSMASQLAGGATSLLGLYSLYNKG